MAVTSGDRLPSPEQIRQRFVPKYKDPAAIPELEVFVYDDPDFDEEGDEPIPRPAHAEIRFRRIDDRPDETGRRIRKSTQRIVLGDILADCFDVHLEPR